MLRLFVLWLSRLFAATILFAWPYMCECIVVNMFLLLLLECCCNGRRTGHFDVSTDAKNLTGLYNVAQGMDKVFWWILQFDEIDSDYLSDRKKYAEP